MLPVFPIQWVQDDHRDVSARRVWWSVQVVTLLFFLVVEAQPPGGVSSRQVLSLLFLFCVLAGALTITLSLSVTLFLLFVPLSLPLSPVELFNPFGESSVPVIVS